MSRRLAARMREVWRPLMSKLRATAQVAAAAERGAGDGAFGAGVTAVYQPLQGRTPTGGGRFHLFTRGGNAPHAQHTRWHVGEWRLWWQDGDEVDSVMGAYRRVYTTKQAAPARAVRQDEYHRPRSAGVSLPVRNGRVEFRRFVSLYSSVCVCVFLFYW